jgi:hypothetical protein
MRCLHMMGLRTAMGLARGTQAGSLRYLPRNPRSAYLTERARNSNLQLLASA